MNMKEWNEMKIGSKDERNENRTHGNGLGEKLL
jgi:hypothetical protein